jgi:hypothetical protein
MFETGSGLVMGDVKRAVERIYEFAHLPSDALPLRWALGKDAVAAIPRKLEQVREDTVRFEGWSGGLELELEDGKVLGQS